MPTLRQIHISQETRDQLAGTKRARPNDTTSSISTFVPIRTASALLSRDPRQLALTLDAPLGNVKNLRAGVADSLISDPFVGHADHAAEVVAGVTRWCVDVDGLADLYARDSRSSEKDAPDERNQNNTSFHNTLRSPPLIIGAITALDLCAQTLFTQNINVQHNLEYIGTGSIALDQLLTPNHAYSSFEHGLALPFPFNIPRRDNFAQPSDTNQSTGGISFGMVTEFSGPPSSGKTQLALSIAARACVIQNLQVKLLISGGGGGSSRMAVSRRLFTICVELAKSLVVGDDGSSNQVERQVRHLAQVAIGRVTLACVSDAYSLLATLAKIEGEQVAPNNNAPGTLLIIDSISGCIGHHLSGGSSLAVGAALANQVALMLRRMAKTLDGRFDSVEQQNGTDDNSLQSPRRFAVVVTNGSVAKRSLDNETVTGRTALNKPAMGRYWQVSHVGVWLEEESNPSADGGFQLSDFYEDAPIAGLHLAGKKVVRATLQNHYGKSCNVKAGVNGQRQVNRGKGGKTHAKFLLRSCGVADD